MRILISAVLVFAALTAAAGYLPFTKTVLSNGLTVILHEDHTVPVVSVNTWVKVGAADEKSGETGRAHLFEHFMFEGSEHVPQGTFDSTIYAMGGTNNAWTGFDETNYYTLVPSNGLGEALRLESDRLGYLRKSINPDALNKQIGIVVNELAQRRDGPYADARPESAKLLWPQGHAGRNSPGGAPEDVKSTTPGDAGDFHRTFYNPNNVILVVAGDFETADALAMIKKWYGGIPRGAQPPARNIPPFRKLGSLKEKTISNAKAVRPVVFMSFRMPDLKDPDYEKLSLLSDVLEGNDAWGLTKALTIDRQLAMGVGVYVTGNEAANTFSINASPAAGVTPDRLKTAILDFIAQASAQGFAPEALPAIKASMKTDVLRGLQNVQDRATTLARGEARFGDPAHFEKSLLRLMAYTDADLKAVAAKYLTVDNLVVVTVVPGEGTGS